MIVLISRWKERKKFNAEGNKLRAEGDKLYTEGDKLCAEWVIILFGGRSIIDGSNGGIKIEKRVAVPITELL